MSKHNLPDLTFPTLKVGARAAPWDLKVLLISALHLDSSAFKNRVLIVQGIHDELNSDLAAGASPITVQGKIRGFIRFFRWVDANKLEVDQANISSIYVSWSEYLLNLVRNRVLKENSAYGYLASISGTLDRVLARGHALIKQTRIKPDKQSKMFHISAGDKLLVNETFQLGASLVSICKQLTKDVVLGPLPFVLNFNGKRVEHWGRFSNEHDLLPNLVRERLGVCG